LLDDDLPSNCPDTYVKLENQGGSSCNLEQRLQKEQNRSFLQADFVGLETRKRKETLEK